jgi:putative PEP-CTERM system histidine kinase
MNLVGLFSYGIAALAFALLSILFAVSWRGKRAGMVLVCASALTAIWAVTLALVPNVPERITAVFFWESLRNASWLFALTVLAAHSAPNWLIRSGQLVAGLVLLVAVGGASVADRASVGLLLSLSRSGLIVAVLGLVLLEQIYRNASEGARTPVRYLAIGVGGLFVYDLFLYSQAELLRGITSEAWYARGFLNALAAPAVAIAARRAPQWSLDVFVSRQVIFYTTSFMGLGVYLLLMALGGFYVREFGGEWGRIGQILFFAGAIVVLVFIVASAPLRRQAQVFISKHFYRNKYDYRVEWLRFIRTLSGDSSADSDMRRNSVRAIAQIFSSPCGILYSFDEAGERFVPTAAWPERLQDIGPLAEMRADDDLTRFLGRTGWIIDLKEYRSSPDVYDNMVLPSWLENRRTARLISPLFLQDSLAGFVVLDDPPPPFELTYEDRDLLKTVGRHVATHLAQQEANRKLAVSRQFEAYNRLTAFMMHDIKNSVAQLQLIVTNADRHKRNPEFVDDAIATIANAVERMRHLIDQFGGKAQAPKSQSVDLNRVAREAVARCSDRMPKPQLEAPDVALHVRADAERLTTAIEHLLRNAQDASSDDGRIGVRIEKEDDRALVEVTDTGIGMDDEFIRERLFRPFDSTKGSKGMGIGAYQVREYARSIGGQLEVQSSPGIGTRFCIRLPLIVASSETNAADAERAAL